MVSAAHFDRANIITHRDGMQVMPSNSHHQPHLSGDVNVEVDSLSREEWDGLMGEFADASYEQSTCLLEDRWGAKRVSHLIVRQNNMVIGGARLLLLKPPGLRGGLAQAKFAPFWRRRDRPVDPAIYRYLISALIEEFCKRRRCYLSIVPRPHPDHYPLESAMLIEMGFAVRRPSFDDLRYFVNLSLGPDRLMRNLDQKWRYNLRQAVKNNIEVQFGDSEGLPTFANLHSAMLSRKKLRSDDPIHLIPELSKRLPSDMRPKVVFAYHEGIAVAGAVIVVVDDLALYLWGASTEEALPLKAGYALQWKVACWLAERNCRWYDLGGGNRDPGIRQFKRGFVGREGSILELDGEFSLCQSIIALLATDAFYYSRNLQLATRRMCTRLARRAKFL